MHTPAMGAQGWADCELKFGAAAAHRATVRWQCRAAPASHRNGRILILFLVRVARCAVPRRRRSVRRRNRWAQQRAIVGVRSALADSGGGGAARQSPTSPRTVTRCVASAQNKKRYSLRALLSYAGLLL